MLKRLRYLLLFLAVVLATFTFPVQAQSNPTDYEVLLWNIEKLAYENGNYVYIYGAVYRITQTARIDDAGNQIPVNIDMGTITIDTTGGHFFPTEKGIYRFDQIQRAPGYLQLLDFFSVEFPLLDNNGAWAQDQTQVVFHKSLFTIGDVQLLKTGDGGKALAGAQFKLIQKTAPGQTGLSLPRQIGDVYTTDAEGKIVIANLREGDYEFIETVAPSGYLLDPTPLKFKIEPNGTAHVEVRLPFANKKFTPTPAPSATPSTPTLPIKPTTTPVPPPNTGTPTEYFILGGGLILLGVFFWMSNSGRRKKSRPGDEK